MAGAARRFVSISSSGISNAIAGKVWIVFSSGAGGSRYEKVVFLLIYSSSSYHVGSTVFTYTNCKPQCEEFRDNQDTKSIKLFFFQNNWNFDKTIEVQSFNTKVEASTRVYVLKRDFM